MRVFDRPGSPIHYSCCFSSKPCLHLQSADVPAPGLILLCRFWVTKLRSSRSQGKPERRLAPQSTASFVLYGILEHGSLRNFENSLAVAYIRSLNPPYKEAALANSQHLSIHLAKIWVWLAMLPARHRGETERTTKGSCKTAGRQEQTSQLRKLLRENCSACELTACLAFLFPSVSVLDAQKK